MIGKKNFTVSRYRADVQPELVPAEIRPSAIVSSPRGKLRRVHTLHARRIFTVASGCYLPKMELAALRGVQPKMPLASRNFFQGGRKGERGGRERKYRLPLAITARSYFRPLHRGLNMIYELWGMRSLPQALTLSRKQARVPFWDVH